MPGLRRKNKGASIFSNEFITTNHGDIISCVCMFFMVGLMFKSTQKFAGVFIAPQNNITKTNNAQYNRKLAIFQGVWFRRLFEKLLDSSIKQTLYTAGRKDICTVFFYTLAWIVVHAVIQEYILDKINRKFHLSKTKISRFNNLGGHIPFYFASAAWGADIILKEGLLPKISNIWVGYPHSEMTFILKFYFILQIAYWVHCFPELYFLKAKKEEILPRIRVYLQYLTFIVPAYVLNLTHLALVCLVIHYLVEFLLYGIKILNYMGKLNNTKNRLMVVWAILYTLARIITIVLSVATFWIGLPKEDNADKKIFHPETNDLIPNFNRKQLRITLLIVIIAMEAWLTWSFILYQVSYWSEIRQAGQHGSAKKKEQKKKGKKSAEKEEKEEKEEKKDFSEDEDETPVSNGKYKTS